MVYFIFIATSRKKMVNILTMGNSLLPGFDASLWDCPFKNHQGLYVSLPLYSHFKFYLFVLVYTMSQL